MEMGIVTHEEMATAILRTAGKVAALEFLVTFAFALHPDKKRILKVWDEYLPGRIDEWMETPEYQSAPFREEMNNALAAARTSLESAAAVDDDGD